VPPFDPCVSGHNVRMPGYVFVSYSSADRSYVDRLAARFQALGVRTWVDRLGIVTGRRWRKEIRDAIDGCDALVVVMTSEAEQSSWVEEELSRAQARSKPIYPLLLEGEPFFGLAATEYEDVKGGSLPSDRFIGAVADIISTPTGNAAGELPPLISRFAGRLMSTFNCGSEPCAGDHMACRRSIRCTLRSAFHSMAVVYRRADSDAWHRCRTSSM
jgi:TIR domain